MSKNCLNNIKFPQIHENILELKKKIQLSDGQQKALQAEYEKEVLEKSTNISAKKKEVSEVISKLKTIKSCHNAVCTLPENAINARDRQIIMLDYQINDNHKVVDLLKYKIAQKEKCLCELNSNLQSLKCSTEPEHLLKVKKNYQVKIIETQNKIDATTVQYREALLVENKYESIRKSLLQDRIKFENRINLIIESIESQNNELIKIEKVYNEAIDLRIKARTRLINEELVSQLVSVKHLKQNGECRQFVSEKKKQLEILERNIIHGNRTHNLRIENDEAVDDNGKDFECNSFAIQTTLPAETCPESLLILKVATGGVDINTVYTKICGQQETNLRLSFKQKMGETKKRELEKTISNLTLQLQSIKFAAERNSEEITEEVIRTKRMFTIKCDEVTQAKQLASEIMRYLNEISTKLNAIYSTYFRDKGGPHKDILQFLIKKISTKLVQLQPTTNVDIPSLEKWLPSPYAGILQRAPVLNQGQSEMNTLTTQGSEDEEEIPSRRYIKRQAQMAIDTKIRKKALK